MELKLCLCLQFVFKCIYVLKRIKQQKREILLVSLKFLWYCTFVVFELLKVSLCGLLNCTSCVTKNFIEKVWLLSWKCYWAVTWFVDHCLSYQVRGLAVLYFVCGWPVVQRSQLYLTLLIHEKEKFCLHHNFSEVGVLRLTSINWDMVELVAMLSSWSVF